MGVSSQWWDDESLLNGTTCSSMSDVFTVLNMSLIMRAIPLNESNIEDDVSIIIVTIVIILCMLIKNHCVCVSY